MTPYVVTNQHLVGSEFPDEWCIIDLALMTEDWVTHNRPHT